MPSLATTAFAGFVGRLKMIVGFSARPSQTYRMFVQTTGYINYTCKYTGGREIELRDIKICVGDSRTFPSLCRILLASRTRARAYAHR